MVWNNETTSTPVETKTLVKCNGNSYDVTGVEGLGLVDKLKAIARDNGISKFDIYDGDNKNLSPSDIESGNFEGDLSLVRFNVAA
ncbi:MAG TPA: hypothetical protein VIL99_16125 [Ignavibacteria bacterium]